MSFQFVSPGLIDHYSGKMEDLHRWYEAACGEQLESVESVWHKTRRAEYPWALERGIEGKVLDVGSNPQFPFACLEGGIADHWTIHHTYQDLGNNFYYDEGRDIFQLETWDLRANYSRHHRQSSMVLSDPDLWNFPEGGFDTVLNISVVEHVEPENFFMWADAIWDAVKPGGKLLMTVDGVLPGFEINGFWRHPWGAWAASAGLDPTIFPSDNDLLSAARYRIEKEGKVCQFAVWMLEIVK